MDSALTISFTSAGSGSSAPRIRAPFVHLEQIKQPQIAKTVTMTDIASMIARARMGISARTYKPEGCAGAISGDTISVWFEFYVWPSAKDQPYAITASLGNVENPVVVHKPTEFSKTFELSDRIELDFIMDSIESYSWETDCWDADGVRVDEKPDVYLENYHTIRASKPVFGVVRIHGKKRGNKFTLTQRMVKTVPVKPDGSEPDEGDFNDSGAGHYYSYDEWLSKFFGRRNEDDDGIQPPVNLTGLRISNLQVSVTAHYFELGGKPATETLRLEVPQCIKDLLEVCGVDTDGDGIIDSWDEDAIFRSTLTLCGPDDDDPPTIVYVSGCTGKKIGTRSAGDDDSGDWCGHHD